MSDPQMQTETGDKLPQARVRQEKWRFPVVWVVPLLAAIVAGYLIYYRAQDYGASITIKFKDGSGLVAGQTPLKYRGVPIGQVEKLALSEDLKYVVVTARLRRSAGFVARKGAAFWIVRPEVRVGNVTGLGTVITGPDIVVEPGSGAAQSEFVGFERPPVAPGGKGLRIVLRAQRLGNLSPKTPLYYRGVEVGSVQNIELSADTTRVDINVLVQPRYAKLVRDGSRFWDVSGLKVRFGIFRGLDIDFESLNSLVAGGIAFATPEGSKAAKNGTVFPLHGEPSKEWLEWAPAIRIPPET